jgi:hypothetical protein
MGAVTFSLDPALLDCLRAALRAEVFVETGTFEGATAAMAAASFPEVHSVELSEEYFRRARERLSGLPGVQLHHGPSARVLRDLRPRLQNRRAIYWLDAHWCEAGATAGAESQCPLLDELTAVARLNEDSAVLIDDARLFLCPPAGAHRAEQWPSLDGLVRRLLGLGVDHELMILNDVICLYPRRAADAMRALAPAHAFDWLRAADKSRDYDKVSAQLAEKESLIARLHGEAGRLQQDLAATCENMRRMEQRYLATLKHPLKLAGFYAKAVAKKCGQTVFRRKSA